MLQMYLLYGNGWVCANDKTKQLVHMFTLYGSCFYCDWPEACARECAMLRIVFSRQIWIEIDEPLAHNTDADGLTELIAEFFCMRLPSHDMRNRTIRLFFGFIADFEAKSTHKIGIDHNSSVFNL